MNNNKELKHFGVLGIHWGRRKAHQDHNDAKLNFFGDGKRQVAKHLTRASKEEDLKRAVKAGLLKKPIKTGKEMSNAELNKLLGGKIMQQKLKEIDDKKVKRGRIVVGVVSGLLVANFLLNASTS